MVVAGTQTKAVKGVRSGRTWDVFWSQHLELTGWPDGCLTSEKGKQPCVCVCMCLHVSLGVHSNSKGRKS